MYGVNLDLLRTTPHHADGRYRDRHAHHRAEHLAVLAEERGERRRVLLGRVLGLLRGVAWQRTKASPPCH